MVLLLASFDEFTLFLKIVLWIAIPLIIVSFTVTTILHYRQKKKNALKADNDDDEILVNEVVDISLVSRLQKEVLHYKRRIKELQHALSFAKEVIPTAVLKSRVAAMNEDVTALNINPSISTDIQIESPIAPSKPGTEGGHIALADTGAAQQGHLPSADPDSSQSAAYLHDLVTEQKNLVLFLQQQLESRIKAFHDLETQFRENAAVLEKMTLSYEHIKHQLDDSDAAASMHRIEKDSMQAQITRLENSLSELQEQHNTSLKLLDQQPVNNLDKNLDTSNHKLSLAATAEAELSENGHS